MLLMPPVQTKSFQDQQAWDDIVSLFASKIIENPKVQIPHLFNKIILEVEKKSKITEPKNIVKEKQITMLNEGEEISTEETKICREVAKKIITAIKKENVDVDNVEGKLLKAMFLSKHQNLKEFAQEKMQEISDDLEKLDDTIEIEQDNFLSPEFLSKANLEKFHELIEYLNQNSETKNVKVYFLQNLNFLAEKGFYNDPISIDIFSKIFCPKKVHLKAEQITEITKTLLDKPHSPQRFMAAILFYCRYYSIDKAPLQAGTFGMQLIENYKTYFQIESNKEAFRSLFKNFESEIIETGNILIAPLQYFFGFKEFDFEKNQSSINQKLEFEIIKKLNPLDLNVFITRYIKIFVAANYPEINMPAKFVNAILNWKHTDFMSLQIELSTAIYMLNCIQNLNNKLVDEQVHLSKVKFLKFFTELLTYFTKKNSEASSIVPLDRARAASPTYMMPSDLILKYFEPLSELTASNLEKNQRLINQANNAFFTYLSTFLDLDFQGDYYALQSELIQRGLKKNNDNLWKVIFNEITKVVIAQISKNNKEQKNAKILDEMFLLNAKVSEKNKVFNDAFKRAAEEVFMSAQNLGIYPNSPELYWRHFLLITKLINKDSPALKGLKSLLVVKNKITHAKNANLSLEAETLGLASLVDKLLEINHPLSLQKACHMLSAYRTKTIFGNFSSAIMSFTKVLNKIKEAPIEDFSALTIFLENAQNFKTDFWIHECEVTQEIESIKIKMYEDLLDLSLTKLNETWKENSSLVLKLVERDVNLQPGKIGFFQCLIDLFFCFFPSEDHDDVPNLEKYFSDLRRLVTIIAEIIKAVPEKHITFLEKIFMIHFLVKPLQLTSEDLKTVSDTAKENYICALEKWIKISTLKTQYVYTEMFFKTLDGLKEVEKENVNKKKLESEQKHESDITKSPPTAPLYINPEEWFRFFFEGEKEKGKLPLLLTCAQKIEEKGIKLDYLINLKKLGPHNN